MSSRPITLLCFTLRLLLGVPSCPTVFITDPPRPLPLWSHPKRYGDIIDSVEKDLKLINGLLEKAEIDPTQTQVKLLGDNSSDNQAFCNRLYRIHYQLDTTRDSENKPATVVAKIFSELAVARMTHTVGELDTLIGEAGIGPKILSSLETGILMEDCDGKVLTEQDVHLDGNKQLLTQCAQTLAKLHNLRPCASHETNVFFHSCREMLSRIPVGWSLSTDTCWTRSRLASCLEQHRLLLQNNDLKLAAFSVTGAPNKTPFEMTGSGHGDCKPSNIMIIPCGKKHQNASIKLIDLELSGKHYRAYDLAKFWRTSKYLTSSLAKKLDRERRRHFLEAYYQYSPSLTATLPELEQQVDLMEPLTWLEAAIFFASMESAHENSPKQQQAWVKLTTDRLQNYERSKEL